MKKRLLVKFSCAVLISAAFMPMTHALAQTNTFTSDEITEHYKAKDLTTSEKQEELESSEIESDVTESTETTETTKITESKEATTDSELDVEEKSEDISPQLLTDHGEEYTREKFNIDSSFETLTPGTTKDGFITAESGVMFGFRGMMDRARAGVNTTGTYSHGYFEPIILKKGSSTTADRSYVYNNSYYFTAQSINPYVNGTRINKGSNNSIIGLGNSGITRYSYQKDKEMYFFKKDSEDSTTGELRAVMYTEDGFDIEFTLVLDKAKGVSSQRWEFINNREEDIDFAVMEYVDTFVDSDSVPIYSLGADKGFYMQVKGKEQFNVILQDNNKNWLTAYTHFIPGMITGSTSGGYTSVRYNNAFGDDFATPGYEGRDWTKNQQMIPGRDSGYQLGTDVKTLKPGESLTTGADYYYGDAKTEPELDADTPEHVYYDTASTPADIHFDLDDVEGQSDKLYIKYNDDEPELIDEYQLDENHHTDGNIPLDQSRLHLGDNIVELYAENNIGVKSNMVDLDEEVRHLEATPEIAKVKQKEELSLDPFDAIIKEHNTIHDPVLSYGADGPVDTSDIGFKWSDVILADSNTPDIDKVEVKVPTNIYGKNTELFEDDLVAIDAIDVELTVAEVNACENEAALLKLIQDKAELKAWKMDDGADPSAAVTSTTTKAEEGTYKAVITATGKDNAKVNREINVLVEDDEEQELAIVEVPDTIAFEKTAINSSTTYVNKEENVDILLNTSLGVDWLLTVNAENFKNSDGEEVENILINKRNGLEEVVSPTNSSIVKEGSAADASSNYEIMMSKDDGLLLKVKPGQVKSKNYTSVVTWTLTSDPTR
ncbi:hypothetical protein [Enterococcus termitis]|uniref:WxL domain-containing protein n=1 Tax=Enterococcus termitis TaxID=332950 RepID=A0A1E5GAV1_9ENTE|nr:hypothetical protein [Enterococcus termitis]OEG09787.1 hypothetical protein BCR25_09775 [Enterococcus termitis]OJG96918.1 hypothetical protein RV18_GL001756 [Enterococcus termitis]